MIPMFLISAIFFSKETIFYVFKYKYQMEISAEMRYKEMCKLGPNDVIYSRRISVSFEKESKMIN